MRHRRSPRYSDNLITLLEHSHNCNASDKRDHIYAFLGLTSNIYGLMVDYSTKNSPGVLYTQLARRMVEKNKNLAIFSHVGTNNRQRLIGLPSWVPGWSCRFEDWTFHINDIGSDNNRIPCWGDAFEPWTNDNFRALQLHGICLDTVVVGDTKTFAGNRQRVSFSTSEGRTIEDYSGILIFGDEFWALHGADNPVVLRPHGASFEFIALDRYSRLLNSLDTAQHATMRLKLQQTPVRITLV
jgi:hypothetical protein